MGGLMNYVHEDTVILMSKSPHRIPCPQAIQSNSKPAQTGLFAKTSVSRVADLSLTLPAATGTAP